MLVIVNFKNYKHGSSALALAKTIQKHLPKAVVAVPATEINEVSKKTRLKVIAQHVDAIEGGRGTGFIIAEALKAAGAKGSLINHSEHQVRLQEIKQTTEAFKALKMQSIVCAKNLSEVKQIMKFKPDMIAFEDPKLIATGQSITTYNPKALKQFVHVMKRYKAKAICGAGISSAEDVMAAKAFGCKGVLIASAIANARNPGKVLKELKRSK